MRPDPSTEFLNAFEAWCHHQRLFGRLRRGSSEAVYRAMWRALAAWCIAQDPALRLATLDGASLLSYLASRNGISGPGQALTVRYQWRLLSLVHWVQSYQPSLGPARQRPQADAAARLIAAQPTLRRANAADDKNPPSCLSDADCAQLLACLRAWWQADKADPPDNSAPEATDQAVEPQPPDTQPSAPRWQTWRNRCAVALQLGAGLGPGDVRALRVVDVLVAGGPPHQAPDPNRSATHPPAQLRVPASGSAPLHITAIAPWAAHGLAQWLELRQQEALAGPWLFPSTRSGKPWGKVAQYGSVHQVLIDAGLTPGAGGSFRLRHSFALRQLQAGQAPEIVARWLGVIDPEVMARYQRLLDTSLLDTSQTDDGHPAGGLAPLPDRPV
jgi:hypothetical protein